MNTDLADACICYGLYDNDIIVGFLAVLHHPCTNKKLKRVSRLVILPDYQGIGLGTKFLNAIAKIYSELGWDFCIITSAKNLIWALRKSNKWCLYRCGKVGNDRNGKLEKKMTHRNCSTASFMYKKGG